MQAKTLTRKMALMAFSLSLAACTPAPTSTVPSTAPSADPSAPASVAPSTPASTEPGASPSAAPSTGPSASGDPSTAPSASASVGASAPAPDPNRRVILSGKVYDQGGATVNGALVTVKSLDASVPYTATATTVGGSWVVNNVPEGVNVEVVATKNGWTTRRRVQSFQSTSNEMRRMDFGAASGQANPGAAYFLSDTPEVTSTEPATKAIGQDPNQLTYKLVLSEALAESSRKRFEDAIRVFPANEAASPDGIAGNHVDLENVADSPAINVDGTYHYAIKKGTIFLEDTQTAAKVAWNAAGTEATLTFAAPIIAGKSAEAKYQVGLVRGAGSEPKIEDLQGKQLGTDEAGSRKAYPAAAGELIRNVFREADLALEGSPTTADQRWNATHDSVATFKVKKDAEAPKLLGIEVNDIGNDLRLELAFSKPMVAFDGSTTGFMNAAVANLANYTFAIGEKAADLADVELDGDLPGNAPVADPSADASFGGNSNQQEREFKLTGAPGTGLGDINIKADPRDAKKVFITIVGRKGWFDADMGAIKARVEKVADPAGNTINDAAADRDVVTGTL